MKLTSGQFAKLVLAGSLFAPLTAGAAVTVTGSLSAPTVGADDQSYLPGRVNEANTIAGGATSGINDAWTYIANDRPSKAQSFTTGANVGGYSLNSISVQHIHWNTFTSNGTFFNIQNGDTFDIRVGTLSGTIITPVFTNLNAIYSGSAMANGSNSSGTGTFFTFNFSSEEVTLAPSTLYVFEIAPGTGDPFFELNSTSANGYAGGGAFTGNNNSVLDTDGNLTSAPSGDFVFHVGLTSIPEPSAALLGALGVLVLLRRRR